MTHIPARWFAMTSHQRYRTSPPNFVRQRSHRQAGFTFVNVLGSIAAMTIASAAVFQLAQSFLRSQKAVELTTIRKGLDEQIRDRLNTPESMLQTLQSNQDFQNQIVHGCPRPAGGTLTIRHSTGSILVPRQLDERLNGCSGNCAFAHSASWNCQNGNFWIELRTAYRAGLNISGLNNAGGSFSSTIPLSATQWRNVLTDPSSPHDRLCNATTEVMIGLNPDGSRNCAPRVNAAVTTRGQGQFCPTGSAMVGISNQGNPVCEDFANQIDLQICIQMSDRSCRRQWGQEQCCWVSHIMEHIVSDNVTRWFQCVVRGSLAILASV
jgi:hypothetical protein